MNKVTNYTLTNTANNQRNEAIFHLTLIVQINTPSRSKICIKLIKILNVMEFSEDNLIQKFK